MKTAYSGARIYHDGILIEDHALLAENGKTLAVVAAGDIPADATVHHLDGGILTPGFIETQANGGGGYLVNDRFDADGLAHILAAHRQYGTVAMLPTFITDAQDNYHRAIASIAEASRTVPGILGGHFEGPFLSPEKKGTHNPAYLRTPDESDFACFAAHADALQYSIISLAPERVPAGTVRRIREMGIRVNAAHTMAGKADMQRAWAEADADHSAGQEVDSEADPVQEADAPAVPVSPAAAAESVTPGGGGAGGLPADRTSASLALGVLVVLVTATGAYLLRLRRRQK